MPKQAVPLRLCTVVNAEGETVRPYVRCPRRSETIDALSCMGCMRMRSVEWDSKTGGAVTCSVEPTEGAQMDRRADFAEAAARSQVHEIVPSLTTCISSEVSADQARGVLAAKGLRAIAIVDADGKLLGVLTSSELATSDGSTRVADLVPANGHSLRADAPIGHAIALMAFEDLHAVPCVTAEGKLTGVCEVGEVLRWVARSMGYTPPPSGSGGG